MVVVVLLVCGPDTSKHTRATDAETGHVQGTLDVCQYTENEDAKGLV